MPASQRVGHASSHVVLGPPITRVSTASSTASVTTFSASQSHSDTATLESFTVVRAYRAPPRALMQAQGPQALSAPQKSAPAQPLATRLVEARPHAGMARAYTQLTEGVTARAHELMLKPTLRAHPGFLLALFVVVSAGVGTARAVNEMGDSMSDWLVEDHLRPPTHWLQRHVGTPAQVPLALGCEALSLIFAFNTRMLASVAGVMAGAASGLGVLPALLCMPESLQNTLADGLASYLTLQRRFEAVERMLRQPTLIFHRADQPLPEPSRPLGRAFERLHETIESLAAPSVPEPAVPPAHRHFKFVNDFFLEHPRLAARMGVPPPPPQHRVAPVEEGLWAYLQGLLAAEPVSPPPQRPKK